MPLTDQAATNNIVLAQGQTIALPAGQYNSLKLLATGFDYGASNATFTVTYTDGTSTQWTQSFSDWASNANEPGETVVEQMTYRNTASGPQDIPMYLYGYTITLDPSKTVQSITLPSANVAILAMDLIN